LFHFCSRTKGRRVKFLSELALTPSSGRQKVPRQEPAKADGEDRR
jgi:hypothetical protein